MTAIDKFFGLLARAPEGVQACFDTTKKSSDLEALRNYIAYASRGEQTMAKFFGSVWQGRDNWDFDFLDVGGLSIEYRSIIAEWVMDPVWP